MFKRFSGEKLVISMLLALIGLLFLMGLLFKKIQQLPDSDNRVFQTEQVLKILVVTAIVLLLLFLAVLVGFFRMRRLQVNKDARVSEERKLKISEQANVFERITDAFVALDANWQYTYVNARAAEMLDRRPEELLGKNIWDIFPVPEGNPFYDSYHTAMNRQEYTYLEAYYPPFDKWIENHIYPSPEGISIFFSDITDRKKYQQKLQLSEQRFRSMIENGSEIIALVGADFRIQYMSPSIEKILGYRAVERIGTNPLETVHPDDRPMIQEILGSLLKQPGSIAVAQWRHRHADKTWRWMDGTATNLLHDPSVNAIVHNFRDITDRRKMEQELRQSEEKYKLLFYESPLPMIICDAETLVIIDVNQSAVEQYGYDNRSFTHLGITDILILQKEVDPVHEFILAGKKLSPGKTDMGIWDHRKKSGEIIKVQVKGHILQMNNRECMMLVCNDLTERLKEQEELEFHNERFHYVTEATSDAIWDWDMQKNAIYWGEGFENIFGYHLADLNPQGNTWESMIHPDDRTGVMERIQKAIDDPACRNWSDEYRFAKSGGEYTYVRDKGIMVRNANGKVIRMIGAMQDIAGIKREEEQLRLLESVVTYANDSVIITEAEPLDGDHPKIVYVNNAFTKVTGYSSKEVIGKTPRILQGPETSRKQLDKLRKSLRKWQPCEIEVVNYKKNGEPFWLSISVAPVADKNGHYTHWISVQRDITERKRVEAELHNKNDELKRLSDYLQNIREEERKLMAQEVHEELGQLVSALKIDVDWLGLKMAAALDSTAEKRMDHANKIMGVLLKSIRKMASDLRPSVLDDFGLNEALQWYCSDFEMLHKVHCVFVSEIDDSRLTQKTTIVIFRIIQESLINVARHAGAKMVKVTLTEDTQTLCLSVVDDGKGFQIGSARSTLGLVGLRERAFSIGGELRIESVPGEGTRVEAFIPQKQ